MALRATFLLVLAVAQLSPGLANTAADGRQGAIHGRKLQQWHDRDSQRYYSSDRSDYHRRDSQPMNQMGIGGTFVYTWYTSLGTAVNLCFPGVGLGSGCGCQSGTTCTIVQYVGSGALFPVSVAGTTTQTLSFPKSMAVCADTAGTICQSIATKSGNLLKCSTAADGCATAADRSYDRYDQYDRENRDQQRVQQMKVGVTPPTIPDPYKNLLGVTTCGPAGVVNQPNCGCTTVAGSSCQFVGNHGGTDVFYCLTNNQCNAAYGYGGGYSAWTCSLASGCPAADRSYDNMDYERYENRDYERYDNRDVGRGR